MVLVVEKPVPVQEVTFTPSHESEAGFPDVILLGVAVRETVGGGGGGGVLTTFTVTLAVALPPAPVQVTIKTEVAESTPVPSLPENGIAALDRQLAPGATVSALPTQDVAFVDDH